MSQFLSLSQDKFPGVFLFVCLFAVSWIRLMPGFVFSSFWWDWGFCLRRPVWPVSFAFLLRVYLFLWPEIPAHTLFGLWAIKCDILEGVSLARVCVALGLHRTPRWDPAVVATTQYYQYTFDCCPALLVPYLLGGIPNSPEATWNWLLLNLM